MNSLNTTARIAGLLYLIYALLAFFGIQYVPGILIVSGDAATTAKNIMASELLFRLGIVSTLVVQIANILMVLILYRLFKPVNKNMALLMVIFVLVGIPITMLNELTQLAVPVLLSGAEYLKVFTADQLQALMSLFLRLHSHGINIASIFWGLWLFPLGYSVFKSGFLPRILGILLMIACFGYVIKSLVYFLFPAYVEIIYPFALGPAAIAELSFILWLLLKGVNVEQWKNVLLNLPDGTHPGVRFGARICISGNSHR